LDKRVCVKHAGVKVTRVLCDTDGCMCFVHVPIKVGAVGNPEMNEWHGCVYILEFLRRYAKTTGISPDVLLNMNR